jgi:phosphinothricin acetyltransferase
VQIRPPREEDLPELLLIYNHYVETTHVTFDVAPLSLEQRRAWLAGFSRGGPHRLLVADLGGRPVGYASSSQFRTKPAYARSVETTVYVAHDRARTGIGHALYSELLARLSAEPSVHRGYGGIALPNAGSIALHERLGFVLAGTFREVGFKSGKYWDVMWYEKDLELH